MRKQALTRHRICQHHDLELLSLQKCETYMFVVYKLLADGIFVIADQTDEGKSFGSEIGKKAGPAV